MSKFRLPRRIFTPDEVRFLEQNREAMSAKDMADALGRTEASVRERLAKQKRDSARPAFWGKGCAHPITGLQTY